MSEITIFRLRIKGAVQGVGYRDWAVTEAKARGLDGWVRNRSDGSVEILIAGADAKVEEMLKATTQGPPAAQVTNIDIHKETDMPDAGFVRRPSM